MNRNSICLCDSIIRSYRSKSPSAWIDPCSIYKEKTLFLSNFCIRSVLSKFLIYFCLRNINVINTRIIHTKSIIISTRSRRNSYISITFINSNKLNDIVISNTIIFIFPILSIVWEYKDKFLTIIKAISYIVEFYILSIKEILRFINIFRLFCSSIISNTEECIVDMRIVSKWIRNLEPNLIILISDSFKSNYLKITIEHHTFHIRKSAIEYLYSISFMKSMHHIKTSSCNLWSIKLRTK